MSERVLATLSEQERIADSRIVQKTVDRLRAEGALGLEYVYEWRLYEGGDACLVLLDELDLGDG